MGEQQPGQASAQSLEQAKAEIAKGNTASAATFVRQAVGRADTTPHNLAAAAQVAAELGMDEAFGWFMRAGRLMLDAGSIEDARGAFEAARGVDEKNYETIFELGRCEIASGNKAGGLGKFAEVLRKSHYTFVPALFEAGRVYEDDDQIDQAILTFKRIVERDKNHADALAHLGRLHRIKQMAPEATSYLLASAEAARKVMDYALALQCARDILEFDPGNARARGLESEMEKIAPQPRERKKLEPAPEPKPAPPPPPPPVQQVAAQVVPPDYKAIEQQSKATLELAQVTAAIAEAYKQRLAIEEQIKAAQSTLDSVAGAKSNADLELAGIKAQLDNVAKARAAEEATLNALSAKLEQARASLVSIEALHEHVKQADEQRANIVKSFETMQTDLSGTKTKAEKSKTDAAAVEKALLEVTGSFAALKKEAEGAKAVLDAAKTHADKAKADAAAADAAVAKAREAFDAAKNQVESSEKKMIEAAARAHAVTGDASTALSGIGDAEALIATTLAAQKGIEAAVGQLRALALALTERRKQTEATLAQIQGLGEPQAAGLSGEEIARLEAGLAAAIEHAGVAKQPSAPVSPTPAPAASAPPPAAAAVKPNGAAASPETAKPKVEPVKAEAQKAEPKPEPVKAEAAKAEAVKAEAVKASAKADAPKEPEKIVKVEAAKPEPPKAAEKPVGPKADDTTPAGIYARGVALLEGGKPQEAIKTLEPLQNNAEFAVLVQTALGRCHAQTGNYDEALARYSKALDAPGHPEEQYHEALYYMAAAHEARDDEESRELAVWALEEVAAANPKYRDVGARLDALKSKTGKAAASGGA